MKTLCIYNIYYNIAAFPILLHYLTLLSRLSALLFLDINNVHIEVICVTIGAFQIWTMYFPMGSVLIWAKIINLHDIIHLLYINSTYCVYDKLL